jgi:hypothetical protein
MGLARVSVQQVWGPADLVDGKRRGLCCVISAVEQGRLLAFRKFFGGSYPGTFIVQLKPIEACELIA